MLEQTRLIKSSPVADALRSGCLHLLPCLQPVLKLMVADPCAWPRLQLFQSWPIRQGRREGSREHRHALQCMSHLDDWI